MLYLGLFLVVPVRAQLDSIQTTLEQPVTHPDTMELPIREGKPPPLPPAAAKTILVPTDEDRQLGNLGDVLERMAGLHVVRTGQLGDYLGVSIRGSSEQQVNVYVNGILKNPGADPSLFLGDWDLSRVEHIEVYKGLAPDNLPGSPMGGAINIVTREGGRRIGSQAALGAGSFGSFRGNGGIDVRRKAWNVHAQIARDQSDGDFTYYDDNGTEFQPGRFPNGAPRLGADDLVRKTRGNNAHAFSEMDMALTHLSPSAIELGIQADFSKLHKEIPAPYANIDSTVAVTAVRGSERFTGRTYGRWAISQVELSGDLSVSHQGDTYTDTSSAGGAVGVGYDDQVNDYDDALASFSARAKITERLTISALSSYGIAGYLFTDNVKDRTSPRLYRYTGEGKLTPTFTFDRHTFQGVLGATIHLQEQHGQSNTYPGGTLTQEDWGRHQSLRLGYQYRPRDGLWFSAQGGSAYRIPTFMEQFGDRGSVLGNPSLRSEVGLNGSAGVHAENRHASGEIQGFFSDGRRIITLVQNSQNVLIYRNSGATRVVGSEIRIVAMPWAWTRSEVDLTLQQALNLSGGTTVDDYKLIPYRPLTQASLRQTFLYKGWTTSTYIYYQGLAYPNPSNRPSLFDSYSHNTEWQSRCDLTLSKRLRHLMVSTAVRNFFDSRNFDFFNFPLPGRSYSAALQINL